MERMAYSVAEVAEQLNIGAKSVTHEFQVLRVKANIKPITFHGLRHTWSTLANQLGISALDRMTQLGHSDTRLTDMVYTAVPTEQLREAAKKMEQLIGY